MVSNGVATDGDAGSIRVRLGGAHFADDAGMGNIVDAVLGYRVEHDRAHGVCSINAFALWRGGQ